jgi:hypothetical protein
MSDPGPDLNLVQEYRREYVGGFHPLQLWRDRRAILANPEIAVRAHPPLANAPVRFALSFGLVPILAIGWCMSQLVEVLYPERERSGVVEQVAEPVRQVLREALADLDDAQLAALAKSVPRTQLDPAAAPLWKEAREAATAPASINQDMSATRRDAARAWLDAVRASPLDPGQQRVLIAKAHEMSRQTSRLNRFVNDFTRSVAEGGPVMQAIGAAGMLLGAWLFGQTVRGDPRFPLAVRADRFYLYYGTSLLFWFLPATAVAYGVGSFASAAGNTELYRLNQGVMIAIAATSMVYLLAHSGRIARVLAGGELARGMAFAVAWRLLAALFAAQVCLMVVGMILGVIGGVLFAILLA